MANQTEKPNHLIHESSPYLLQHAYNPVDWHPWNDKILDKAHEENKPLLISIGYAACHWCHVMEKESFEDEEVARIMNENFICVKIDREERPDIDQIYMTAVQLLTGNGGWPLHCFAMPDGKPFFGGTYFPKDTWMKVLTTLSHYYQQDQEKILNNVKQIEAGIVKNEQFKFHPDPAELTREKLDRFISNFKNIMDFKNGGTLGAPKFPMPNHLLFLLHYYYHTHDKDVLNFTDLSLNSMLYGGIFDQIGGGFARYSTDTNWKVPHFEKMLYDNGQLLSAYSLAYQLTGKKNYQRVISATAEFLEREMTSGEGGFYSSIDADSEGEEGQFYTWHITEFQKLFAETELAVLMDYYSINPQGNWENGKNILHVMQDENRLADKYHKSVTEIQNILKEANLKLFTQREKKVRPLTDDKIISSWNALAIKGLLDAYRAIENPDYLNLALKNAAFLKERLFNHDGSLLRTYKNMTSKIRGFLDDYAFVAQALIHLYQVTMDEQWIKTAKKITDYAINYFFDEETGFFSYTSHQEKTIVIKQKELDDNVLPSSNSTMALNLFMLSRYYDNEDYEEKARQMLRKKVDDGLRKPSFHTNWGILLTNMVFGSKELVVTGPEAERVLRQINRNFFPNLLVIAGASKPGSELPILKNRFNPGKTSIYVCENKVCKLPVHSAKEAIIQIEG